MAGSDQQSAPPPAPNVPAPGSVPSLPQEIFNLEKKGGDVGGETKTLPENSLERR